MKLTNEKGDDWDQQLEAILFGIRTSVQESTKFTPFFLMHGREARLPLEAEMSQPTVNPDLDTTIARLRKLKEEVHPVAKGNIQKSQHKQKLQYQRRKGLIKSNFKIGDLVLRMNMLKRTKMGHKMEDSWLGPYKILQVTKFGCCKLQCLKTMHALKQKINSSQLKLYLQVHVLYSMQ